MRRTEFVGVRVSSRERKLLRGGAAVLGRKEADFVRLCAVETGGPQALAHSHHNSTTREGALDRLPTLNL